MGEDGPGIVEALVRELVGAVRAARTRSQGRTGGADPGREEILLDIDVHGVRCILLNVPAPHRAVTTLSPRELEIARMVARGLPNKSIASVLQISSWTVSSHLRRVFSKLGVASRAEMVARLLEDSLLRPRAHPGPRSPASRGEMTPESR